MNLQPSFLFPSPPPACFILVLVLSMSNFLFFSCYFWNQVSDLRDCHAQEMCFGSSAICVLWMIRSNTGAARWLINLLQNNKVHWRINNIFIVSPHWIVWNFLSLQVRQFKIFQCYLNMIFKRVLKPTHNKNSLPQLVAFRSFNFTSELNATI